MKKNLTFKKTKAQLERDRRIKEGIAEIKAIAVRMRKRRIQLTKELSK